MGTYGGQHVEEAQAAKKRKEGMVSAKAVLISLGYDVTAESIFALKSSPESD